jgi:rare lipoprotein A
MTNVIVFYVLVTTSSWYGAECEGKLMANGKPFNPAAMTCASWDYPLGTRLHVSHFDGRHTQSVWVTVTDRGPAKRLYRKGRRLDLSRAAFERLDSLDKGLIEVSISPRPRGKPRFLLDKSR